MDDIFNLNGVFKDGRAIFMTAGYSDKISRAALA